MGECCEVTNVESVHVCRVGFAINLQVLLENPEVVFKRQGSKPGMQESDLLKQITRMEDLEPKASNCTRVSPPCLFVVQGYFFGAAGTFMMSKKTWELHSDHLSYIQIISSLS